MVGHDERMTSGRTPRRSSTGRLCPFARERDRSLSSVSFRTKTSHLELYREEPFSGKYVAATLTPSGSPLPWPLSGRESSISAKTPIAHEATLDLARSPSGLFPKWRPSKPLRAERSRRRPPNWRYWKGFGRGGVATGTGTSTGCSSVRSFRASAFACGVDVGSANTAA